MLNLGALWWLVGALLLTPVCAVADVDPGISIGAVISAFVVDQLRAWARRAKSRIAARQWQAHGLSKWTPPRTQKQKPKRKAEDCATVSGNGS